MSDRSRREDVEARLAAVQASINERVGKMEDAVRMPSLGLPRRGEPGERNEMIKIGLSAAAAVVAVWLVSRWTSRKSSDSSGYAGDVAEDIDRFMEQGDELEGAVRRALRRNGPRPGGESSSGGSGSRGLLSLLWMYSLRSAVSSVVSSLLSGGLLGRDAARESGEDQPSG